MEKTLEIIKKKNCADRVVWGTQKYAHMKEMREKGHVNDK